MDQANVVRTLRCVWAAGVGRPAAGGRRGKVRSGKLGHSGTADERLTYAWHRGPSAQCFVASLLSCPPSQSGPDRTRCNAERRRYSAKTRTGIGSS
jgi:hypothetical protein